MINVTYKEAELSQVAEKLLKEFGTIPIWLLEGEMGAGKTTLIKAICTVLGVSEDMSSPTFSIINEYQADEAVIYHFDFYRVEESSELYDLGIEEYFFSGSQCFVEWPAIAEPLLPENYVEISIKLVDGKTRTLTASVHGRTV